MTKKMSTPLALGTLAEQIGFFIQYWGFKKIHGQLWTYIYLSSRPVSAHELGKKLGVSKALISLSMKDLVEYNLIQQVESENKKTKLFVANPDVFNVILNVLRQREAQMLQKIDKTFLNLEKVCAENNPEDLDPNRIEQLGQMISIANLLLQNLIDLKAVDVSSLFSSEANT